MYNVDDAIAKIDGYVISIAGGGPFVGEKKLIRIDEVKRTAAYASLVSDNGAGPGHADRRSEEQRSPVAQRERGGCRAGGRRGSRATPAPRRQNGTIERLYGQAPPWPQRRTAAFSRQGRKGSAYADEG